MNVAIIVKEFPPNVIGGTETQTLRMASELQERTEHEITVYTKSYPSETSQDLDFNLVRVPNWSFNDFVSTLSFVAFALLYLLRDRQEIDVLHCMMIYPIGFVGYIYNTLTKIPYFAWIRGGDYYFMRNNRIKRWMINQVFCDGLVLVQTEAIQRDVHQEFPHATLQVLGNGVSVPDKTADGDKIVFVGRLKRQKGVHVLIEAMKHIDKQLLVVGNGPQKEQLETIATESEVDAEFVGEVNPDAVQKYLRQGSVFVLPSVTGEGLPNALLEAMAIGLPVIGTDTGGVRNAISNGETGFVVPPGDQDALAERLNQLAADEKQRVQMGQAARRYVVEHHSWERMTTELDSIYAELTSK